MVQTAPHLRLFLSFRSYILRIINRPPHARFQKESSAVELQGRTTRSNKTANPRRALSYVGTRYGAFLTFPLIVLKHQKTLVAYLKKRHVCIAPTRSKFKQSTSFNRESSSIEIHICKRSIFKMVGVCQITVLLAHLFTFNKTLRSATFD